MRSILITLISILTLCFAEAQKNQENLTEYTASNGVTYKVGDDIKLARGSDTNGKFVYVNMGGWAISANPEDNRLPATNAGLIVTIKKIKKLNYKRFKGVHFTVGGGNITNYTIDIENAITVCEVENCESEEVAKEETADKYDNLKKLKELFDEGILTQEEYESEKKKLLE